MAWNKNSYYYQNQMKVLSGTDPEPGYTEDDGDTISDLSDRVEKNGLYRFVSLIKAKFDKVKEAIYGAWRLEKEENDFNDPTFEFLDSETNTIDLNDITKVGNYGFYYEEDINIKNKPITNNIAFTLKVSRVKTAQTHVWQDFVTRDGHRWYRYGWDQSGDGTYETTEWGPWMLVLTHETSPDSDESAPKSNEGTADDLFLRRKNDFTIGPIGFGKDPDPTNTVDKSKTLKAKIVLGDYSYGTENPSAHYATIDSTIPKGQIYFQYDENSIEPN